MRSLASERDAATRQLEKEAELTRRVKEEYAQTLLEMQVCTTVSGACLLVLSVCYLYA